jgi:integrase
MPRRLSATITATAIDALQPGDVLQDPKLSGFGARRQRDAVSYFLKCRVNGRQKWFTIGRHGSPWNPTTARKRALDILSNPSIVKKAANPLPQTFAQVSDLFLADHGPRLRPSSLGGYKGNLKNYLLPAFGRTTIADITYSMVSAAYIRWQDHRRAANYSLAILSKIMTWAERHELRPRNSNPCRGIERLKDGKRQVFLKSDDLARLGAALDKAEAEHLMSLFAVAAIRLLIFTGARKSEILTLKWTYIDFERGLIFLPDSKTGQKTITLNDAAVAVLKSIPRFANNPYVIVGRHGECMVNLHKPWGIIRDLTGFADLRLHDLRHTFASAAVGIGGSLPVLGRQLGHSQPQTTQRYSHLADDPVRQLTQATGQVLAEALGRKPH